MLNYSLQGFFLCYIDIIYRNDEILFDDKKITLSLLEQIEGFFYLVVKGKNQLEIKNKIDLGSRDKNIFLNTNEKKNSK
jgi:hypothetical protein